MPSRWLNQIDFSTGELEPRALGRLDIERYPSAVALARNVLLEKTGSARRRGGWRYVADLGAKAQLFDWQSDEGVYLPAVCADGNLRLFDAAGTLITTLASAFGSDSIGEVDEASDGSSVIFFHGSTEYQWLHREGSNLVFEPFPVAKDGPGGGDTFPQHRFQGPGVTLDPSGTAGNVTLTTSKPHWMPEHVGSIVRYAIDAADKGSFQVTGYVSETVVNATVLNSPSNHAARENWAELAWSDGRGWPVSGCWHQGRLVIGGTRDLPNGLWMSEIVPATGAVEISDDDGISFDLGAAEDDKAIWTRIRADEGAAIRYVRSQGPLIILADGTEWIVPQAPVTPTNISFDRQASQGASRIPPADLDGAIVYVRSDRAVGGDEGEQPVIHLAWDELAQRYRPSDISVLGQHLVRNPVDMAAARGGVHDANNTAFLCNHDGTVAALHLPSIERPGITLLEGPIAPYSVAVAAGVLYCAAPYNGAHRLFRLDVSSQLDASAEFDKTPSFATSVGTFPWLANQQVTVKGFTAAGWTVQTATADALGAVTVATAVQKGEVGLPYEWRLQRLPIEASPATIGSLKSPVEARILVRDALAVEIGDADGRVPMTLEDGGTPGDLTTDPATLYTGHLRDHLAGGWSEDAVVELGGTAPWPVSVEAFNVKVEF